jgi:hypothetical protein
MMQSLRLSRFKRASVVPPFQPNARDRRIIQLVQQHRFLRSAQIVSLLREPPQPILRRLQLLYHHGFLERPRAQLDYYHLTGSRPIVYGLGNKGAALLRNELGIPVRDVNWGEKNRSVGRIFLEHALLVSDVMVAFELACRQDAHIRLIEHHDLLVPNELNQESQLFRWRVNLPNNVTLGVIPDRVFGLEYQHETGNTECAYFFLEADRGTMPVKRINLAQTSMYRKLLAYEATWQHGIHRFRFGFHRFRVLTITTGTERLSSLVEVSSQLKSGHGLFLFTDRASISKPEDVFGPIWHPARQDESRFLLN